MEQRKKEKQTTRELTVNSIRAMEGEGNERKFILSFSSEEPYERWWGTEILDHSDGAVDLTRLNEIGVLLFNHDRNRVIGKVNRAWIEDLRGMAEVEFDSDEDADLIYQKVKSGTLKTTSVGYQIDSWEEVMPNKQSADGRFTGPADIARKWTPYEISIVSVPADPTVGVGRELEEETEQGTQSRSTDWFERQLQINKNIITDKEHTAIANFSSRAAFLGGGIVQTITDLLIMFAKSTNSQEAYGYGNSSGYDASLAPTNGVKQNAVVGGGQFYGTKDAKSLNKIFHSIVLGTYQQWMRDPYTLLVNGRYKVSKNYTYDVTGAKYQDTGISLPKMFESDGSTQKYGIFYPHKYQTVPGFGAVPVHPCKGSTSTGGCDGLWQNVEIVAVALRFGHCNNGTDDGLRCLDVAHTAGNADWNIGAAVLLLPPVGVAA